MAADSRDSRVAGHAHVRRYAGQHHHSNHLAHSRVQQLVHQPDSLRVSIRAVSSRLLGRHHVHPTKRAPRRPTQRLRVGGRRRSGQEEGEESGGRGCQCG